MNFPNMLQSRIFDWLETSLLMFQGDLRLYISIRLMMRPMEPLILRGARARSILGPGASG
jgi:hypothetical protein